MSIVAGALSLGRAHASMLFTETLEFFAESGVTIDPVSLAETNSKTVLYTVAGRIKFPNVNSSEIKTSGQVIASQSPIAIVAVGATPNVAADHFVKVIASSVDVSLIGKTFRVTGLAQSGQVTAHRYQLEELS